MIREQKGQSGEPAFEHLGLGKAVSVVVAIVFSIFFVIMSFMLLAEVLVPQPDDH